MCLLLSVPFIPSVPSVLLNFGINSQIVCLIFHFETNTCTEIMSKRFLRDCPIPSCGAKYLVKLSNHLVDVHELSSEDRKRWLQETKLQPKTHFHQSSDIKSIHTQKNCHVIGWHCEYYKKTLSAFDLQLNTMDPRLRKALTRALSTNKYG